MIRTHVLGKVESNFGSIMNHTFSFYEEDSMYMRISELFLNDQHLIITDPKLYRETIQLVGGDNPMPFPVYVDGRQYNSRELARMLYKRLLELGFKPIPA